MYSKRDVSFKEEIFIGKQENIILKLFFHKIILFIICDRYSINKY